jgi:hypothetical protein
MKDRLVVTLRPVTRTDGNRSTFRRDLYCVFGILLIGLIVRWPRMSQSLWYDEMTTVSEYLIRPWQRTVAPRAGEYVPNNHVLHTVLVKLIYPLMTDGRDPTPPFELALRLPSLGASLLLPIALAWGLRKPAPALAGIVAVAAAVNPWLVDLGTEARGYSMLLLLGVVATNLIARRKSVSMQAGSEVLRRAGSDPDEPGPSEYLRTGLRWTVLYAIALAGAIYTVPLAVLLIPAHAVAIGVTRSVPWRRWTVAVTAALLLSALLYLPMARGLIEYYRHPYEATLSMRTLLDWLPRYAWTGERLPRDGSVGSVYWAVPMLVIVIGSFHAWKVPAVRPMLVTLLSATLLGLALAVVDPAAREVRFIPWIAPLFCLALAGATTAVPGPYGRVVGGAGLAAMLIFLVRLDVLMPPNQPIREGIEAADVQVPPGRDIVVLYLGARESIAFYSTSAPKHTLIAAPDEPAMIAATRQSLAQTGHLPWVLIYFEQQAKARDSEPGDVRGLWSNLDRNYHLVSRLPARLGPVALYAPDGEGR